jgi:hypothetical protein
VQLDRVANDDAPRYIWIHICLYHTRFLGRFDPGLFFVSTTSLSSFQYLPTCLLRRFIWHSIPHVWLQASFPHPCLENCIAVLFRRDSGEIYTPAGSAAPLAVPTSIMCLGFVHATKTIGTAVQARLGWARDYCGLGFLSLPTYHVCSLWPWRHTTNLHTPIGWGSLNFFFPPLPLVWHSPGSLVLRVSQPSSPVHFHLDHLEFSFLHPLFTSQRYLISFANIDLPRSTSWARKKLTNLKFRPCSNGRSVPCRTMSTTPPTNPIPMTYNTTHTRRPTWPAVMSLSEWSFPTVARLLT